MARVASPAGRGRSAEGSAVLNRRKKRRPVLGPPAPTKRAPVKIATGRGEQRPRPVRGSSTTDRRVGEPEYRRAAKVLGRIDAGKGDVKDLQNLLRVEGYGIKADGVYGPKTAAAWKSHSGELVEWGERMRSLVRKQNERERRQARSSAQAESGRAKALREQGLAPKVAAGLAREPTPYMEAIRLLEQERIAEETRKRNKKLYPAPKPKGWQKFLGHVTEVGAWEAAAEGINKRIPGAHVPGPPKALQKASQRYNRIVLGDQGSGYKGSSFGGGLPGNLIADIANTTLGFPAGLVSIEEAAREGRFKEDVLKPIAENYAHTYGPLFEGHPGRMLSRMGKHPLGPILDALTVASLGTSASLKATRIATGGKRGVVPRQRIVRYEGGSFQPHASPNQLVRILQHKKDRASEAAPEALLTKIPLGKGAVTSQIPIGLTAGARRRAAKRVPYELEREFERTAAPAVRLQQVRSSVRSPGKMFAYDVLLRYGDKALERLDQEIAFRQERRHGMHREGRDFLGEGKVGMGEAVAQSAQIIGLRIARKHLERPSKRFLRAVEAGRDLTDFYQDTKIALGELNPERAAPRVDLPSRIVTGAKMEPVMESTGFRPGRMMPGHKQAKKAEASLTRLDMLERELEKTTAAFEKTKGLTRPRTEREAKILRATMEEELVDDFRAYAAKQFDTPGGQDPFKGAFGDAKDQLHRNYTNWLIKEFQRGKRHRGTARALREGRYTQTVKGEQLQEFADQFFAEPEFAKKLDALEATEQGLRDLAEFKRGGVGSKAAKQEDEFADVFGPAEGLPPEAPGVKPFEAKPAVKPPSAASAAAIRDREAARAARDDPNVRTDQQPRGDEIPGIKVGPLTSDERAATAQAALTREVENVKAKVAAAEKEGRHDPDSPLWTGFLPSGSARKRKGETGLARAKRYIADLERQVALNKDVKLTDPTKVYELPAAFFFDHVSRDLPRGRIVKQSGQRVHVEMDEATYRELLEDALHYSKSMGEGGFEGRGLIASAQATAKRLSDDPFPATAKQIEAEEAGIAAAERAAYKDEGPLLEGATPEQIGQLQAEYALTFGEDALTGAREPGVPAFGAWAERQLGQVEPQSLKAPPQDLGVQAPPNMPAGFGVDKVEGGFRAYRVEDGGRGERTYVGPVRKGNKEAADDMKAAQNAEVVEPRSLAARAEAEQRIEDAHAHEAFKAAKDKMQVPVELRPYAKNEPGGVAQRSAKAAPEALVEMVAAGEKPAALISGELAPHVLMLLEKQAKAAGLTWLPKIAGRRTNYIVGRGQPEAVRLAEALDMTIGAARTAELGRALGYSEQDVRRFTRRRHGEEAPPEKAPMRAEPPPPLDELSAKRVEKLNRDLVAFRALHNRAPDGPIKDKLAKQIAEVEAKLAEVFPEPAPTLAGEVPEVIPGQRTIEQAERAAKMPNKPSAADYERFLGSEPLPVSERLGTRAGLLRELRDKELKSWDRRKPPHQAIVPTQRQIGKEWVGGEAAGPDARYVPDVAQKAVHSLLSRAQGVLGKQQKARYQYQSEGKLFTQGRVRRGAQVTLEEFHLTRRRAQRTLDQLRASTFTRPLNKESVTWRDPDFVFFNPHAFKIPRGVRDDPAEIVLGMTPAELARADAAFWEDAFPERIDFTDVERAEAAGVRQVHQEIAAAFQQQAPLFVGTKRLNALARAGLGFVDFGNNMTRLGLLYLKGAFVPANFAGNLIFLGIQQGPKGVANLARGSTLLRLVRDSHWAPQPLKNALEVLSDLRAETLARLDIEVGTGASLALVSSKGPLGALTSAVGHASNVLSDRGPRRAAILYEMRKRGFKTDAQITRLLDDPRMRPVLNQIAEEAENAMVRFRGLGRVEREVLSRIIFIYPWIKGATRYGFHLGMDHPVKSAIINAIGEEGHEEMVRRLGELVSYLEHLIPVGEPQQKFGTTVVPVRSPLAITPVGTFGEVMGMIGNANSPDVPPSRRPIRYLQPTLRAVGEALSGVNWSRGYSYQGKTPLDIAADVTVRQYPLVRGIETIRREPQTGPFEGSPAKQPLYVKEGGWKAGLSEIMVPGRKRLLNLPAAHAKRAAEVRTALSDEQRVLYDDKALRTELIAGAKAEKLPRMLDAEYQLDKPLREAITWLTRRNLARVKARNEKDAALNAFEKWEVDLKLARQYKLVSPADYQRHYARVREIWEDDSLATERRDGKITREVTNMGLALFGRDALDDALEALRNKGRTVKRPQLLGS